MIIFHEGLPGSGKSYEAMQSRIIPALTKGREVVAYVEGLDHAKIAELAGIAEARCRELLHVVTREQVQTLHADGNKTRTQDHLPALARDNALLVIDEAQNFWGNRAKLDKDLTEFITEHRHRGIDIVLMGQDVRDVHATWRRRVELKLAFLKLNGLGFAKKYSVTTFRHLGGDEFRRVGFVIRGYDPKFFGSYKSHVSDDTNADVYTDTRAQILSHPVIRYLVPVAIAAACWGGYSAWKFFHPAPPPVVAKVDAPKSSEAAAIGKAPSPAAAASAIGTVAKLDERTPIERRMAELAGKGRIRLAGLISSKVHTSGVIEWVQGGSTVIERLSIDTLRSLGVGVLVTEDVVQLAVGEYRELATPWPLEDMGRVSESRQQVIRGPQPIAAASPVTDISAFGQQRSRDLPGPLAQAEQDTGSLQRHVRRAAQ